MRAAPQSRPAFARLQFLAREIRTKNEIPNTFQVARRWECHHKTINRDLDLLRNFFDYPLAYNPAKNCWQLVGSMPEAVL